MLFGQRLECDVRFAAEKVHGGHGVRVVLERNHEKYVLLTHCSPELVNIIKYGEVIFTSV